MKNEISKSTFKAQALEVMRGVEQSGEAVVITSHGKPTLVIKPYKGCPDKSPLELLEGSVLAFDDPADPMGEDDWEAAN
ncbi:type II toxin-antitoxin system Phd/YefM family antitoxin [Endozoicomonas sp. Mp262]|uniref:type II toxin-antitoxin system Phd/YefM family antitoxin n=1 Tax=Endozoicomonas sp. Mp262 TaxID=2919499 RepID=UPI0021D896A5